MLKKDNRMGLNKEFDRAFKLGQSFYSKLFGVKAVANNLTINRFGILISTKVSKKAVIRNHFKRQIREIIQKELAGLKTGYDIVIIVFPEILDKKFDEIEYCFKKAIVKLKMNK